MLRREVRLRKEFLLKKERELQSSQTISKKRLLQEAIESDKEIPTELRNEARELKHEIDLDVNDINETPSIDDEYANIGQREPKVCVSTSRDPSSR